jgi:hypothetical protein
MDKGSKRPGKRLLLELVRPVSQADILSDFFALQARGRGQGNRIALTLMEKHSLYVRPELTENVPGDA